MQLEVVALREVGRRFEPPLKREKHIFSSPHRNWWPRCAWRAEISVNIVQGGVRVPRPAGKGLGYPSALGNNTTSEATAKMANLYWCSWKSLLFERGRSPVRTPLKRENHIFSSPVSEPTVVILLGPGSSSATRRAGDKQITTEGTHQTLRPMPDRCICPAAASESEQKVRKFSRESLTHWASQTRQANVEVIRITTIPERPLGRRAGHRRRQLGRRRAFA